MRPCGKFTTYAARRVQIDIACLDLGIANMFALHSVNGQRARMSQGEYRAWAKHDSHEEAAKRWSDEAKLPTLPDVHRPVTRVLLNYLAVLHGNKAKFLSEYCSEWRLHARLTVCECTTQGPRTASRTDSSTTATGLP